MPLKDALMKLNRTTKQKPEGGNSKNMKTAEEILTPYIETPFRHTKIVEADNALHAMKLYASQFDGDKSKWIPVSEKTPPDYQRVFFFDTRDNQIQIGFFVWSQTPVSYVSHWRELFEIPSAVGAFAH